MNKGIHFSSRKRKVSIVVKVLDQITQKMFGADEFTATLENQNVKPVVHKQGYHIFMDLVDGTYTVTVEAEGYNANSVGVDVPLPDELFPVVTVEMQKL